MRSCSRHIGPEPVGFSLGRAQHGASWTLYKGRSSIVTMGNTMDWALSAGTGMLVGSAGGSVQVERGKKEGNDRSKGTEAGQRLWLDLSL